MVDKIGVLRRSAKLNDDAYGGKSDGHRLAIFRSQDKVRSYGSF